MDGFAAPRPARGTPAPRPRLVWLLAAGLVPCALAAAWPDLLLWVAAWDVALLALAAVDFALAPRVGALRVERHLEPVLSSGVRNRVELRLWAARPGGAAVRGELRDTPGPGPRLHGHVQRFVAEPGATVVWFVEPLTRGDLGFGDVHVRLDGPLGLCARQGRAAAAQAVKVYPDLTALGKDALQLARADDAPSRRTVRRPGEGRDFESLREYRPGDDRRALDWKATARRARPMVRVHQPEKNQAVLILLDCGRHMAGLAAGRRKLDHAVDAALRVAKVSLDQGDLVGVMAVGRTVGAYLPPRRGAEQLRQITEALYRVEATLDEADWGQAMTLAFGRQLRRALVLVLTDLVDPDASEALVKRTLHLVPRHLPVVASLVDEDVDAVAHAVPRDLEEAHARQAALRLDDDVRRTVARLRDAGAQVVRARARDLGPATVRAYLDLKARGLL